MAKGATPKAQSGPKRNETPPPIRRQAVVVVHGQGEQRPMGTIRDFVRAIWRFNPEVRPDEDKRPLSEVTEGWKSWIVPDDKTGLFELQRITTQRHNGRKTDFFELYYADLLSETPVKNLWRWMRRLLWIDPTDVPGDMHAPWVVFWIASLVAVGLFWVAALSLYDLVHTQWLDQLFSAHAHIPLAIIGLSLLILLAPKFFRWAEFLRKVPLGAIVTAIAVCVLWIYWGNWLAIALDLLMLEFYVAWRFLLPYFGDAASYLSARSETVASRQAVRGRGLELLRALHNDSEFDRVVVVAHSLGSVLAYDLLHILWREVGPTKDNPPAKLDALRAVDQFIRQKGGGDWADPATEVKEFQDAQWKAYDTLRRQPAQKGDGTAPDRPPGWKISDFVTLGSPLASAQFLIADGKRDLDRLKDERMLPTAPPVPYSDDFHTLYTDEAGHEVMHHAAVFVVTRWTNIYDPSEKPFFLNGDPIGGPVSGVDRFGPGIWDRPVKITREGPLPRFFTHNHYWTDTSPDWTQPAAHIVKLREAVGLDRSG